MLPVGFLVNPVAGMGGRPGLKGTDGLAGLAAARGALPSAGVRARQALLPLAGSPVRFLTCSGVMGEDEMQACGMPGYEVVYYPPPVTTARDTQAACLAFLSAGAGLIVFCGGDGTARDVAAVTGRSIPVLGIPAGVKMFSAVFVTHPQVAAAIIRDYPQLPLTEAEVLDIDEEAYRAGTLISRLYATVMVPSPAGCVQHGKQVFEEADEGRALAGIGQFLAEVIRATPATLTLLGPGSTTAAIARALGREKTLLGFDAFSGDEPAGPDLGEEGILGLLREGRPARLVVSPIGAQGFILGRGTQQVSPAVLHRIGIPNVIIVATPRKMAATPVLYVDTGDPVLDAGFGKSARVITGYHTAQRKPVATRGSP